MNLAVPQQKAAGPIGRRKGSLKMAAPQFFTPPRVRPSRPVRHFSLNEANRSLPLVSRIVADIVRVHKSAATQQAQLEKSQLTPKKRKPIELSIESVLERLGALMEELGNVGCDIKDFQIGLIDFIGRHQGRDVCLCWKLGEAQVAYWHEMDAGFAGRQPISTLSETDQ